MKKNGVKIIATNATPGEVRAYRLVILRMHREACKTHPTWDVFGGVLHHRGLWFQVCSS